MKKPDNLNNPPDLEDQDVDYKQDNQDKPGYTTKGGVKKISAAEARKRDPRRERLRRAFDRGK